MTTVLERESQLAALQCYADEARGGEGRMVLISGEAGIGKSTLVDELAAALPDATWWQGACDGLSTPRPLGPLADIAARAGGELRAVCAADASRDARFDALLRALGADGDGTGLHVLTIEDLHWADDATLDMLRFLGRRIRTLRVLLLLTYRDDALAPDAPLRVMLGDLATHRSTRRVFLGPLSGQAVGALAAGTGIDARALYRLTGGSPFFVSEVLAAGSLDVPPSAREVVLARAAGLSVAARRVLDAAAVVGHRVEPGLLAVAAEPAAGSLDELLTNGLLVREGTDLRFRHEIARRAILGEIPPYEAVELHRAVLSALIAAECRDDARLAFHADAAGDVHRVLEHAPRAGRAAATLGSHREAAAQFERAVRFAGGCALAERAAMYDAWADELGLIERWDEAAAARRAAVESWRAVGDPLREGAAEASYGTVMWRLCRGTESRAARRRARELLEPLGATAELATLYATGAEASDPDGLARYVARGVDMANSLGIPALRIRALDSAAYLALGRGEDYETPLLQALKLALDNDLQLDAGRAYANLSEFYATDCRLTGTEPFFREALAYCEEHDVATFLNCARGHYAMALLDAGRWDEALRQANQVLDSKSSPINRLSSLVTVGLVLARRGDPRAVQFLDEADAVAAGVDEPLYLAWAGVPIAEAAWLAGDEDAARERLRALRGRLSSLERHWRAAVIAWEHRLGVPVTETPRFAPYAAQVSGPPRLAARHWFELQMPYHAALALGDSADEPDLREAVTLLDPISPPAARIVRRRMRGLGLRAIPTGVRASTRSDPNGLTPREREVLALLQENLTNEQIAERLVISAKTVDHHVSAVLAKLGVSSRRDAALAAT